MSAVFFDGELSSVASWWRILRRDGVTLGFTTHDRPLRFDGLLHRATPGIRPAAIRRTASLADEETEVEGVLSHASIAADDLAAGLYDGAGIATGLVDWSDPARRATLYRGTIARVVREGERFAAHLSSAKAQLAFDPVPLASPSCRARFCGPGCGLSAIRFTRRATLLDVDAIADRVRFDASFDGDFTDGELRWIDGPQTGLRMAILSAVGGELLLDRPIAPGVAPGHRALIREGCDKTIATCATRFGNAANFRGEPHLPGNDFLAQYPVPR